MKRRQQSAENIFFVILGVFVIYVAILSAPYAKGGLIVMISAFADGSCKIMWCEDTLKCILIYLGLYVVGVLAYMSTRRNVCNEGAYGTAAWGNVRRIKTKSFQAASE